MDFEFDLPGALLARLIEVLDQMETVSLVTQDLEDIPEAQGVYQLFLENELVYIGKTDAEAGLRRRLQRHQKKVQHRAGLSPEDVGFKAVRIYVFTAIDLETQLIAHYGGLSEVRWNGSGFGANDPGRNRDGTKYKDDHFDMLYPIDIDREIDLGAPRSVLINAAELLAKLKVVLPYVFRFEGGGGRSRKPHPDLDKTKVMLPKNMVTTARSVIQAVVSQLPHGWQATQLPSHIILYKEDKAYPQGQVIAKS